MKIFFALLASVSFLSTVQASEKKISVFGRVMTCTNNGKPNDIVHIYVTSDEYQRTKQEEGSNIFEKIMKNPNGEVRVRFTFSWGDDTRELIADVKYQYDANAKKLSIDVAGEKADLIYSQEEKLIRLKASHDFNFLCAESK